MRREGCPCCGAAVSRAVEAVASNPKAEELPLDQHGAFLSGYSARRIFFTYFRCMDCGGMYCPVFYSEHELATLYARQAENMADVPRHARQLTQQRYGDLVMRYSRGAGGFLEIGADIGLFAAYCAKLARFDHLWLYEPNESVHTELRGRLQGVPHSIRAGMSPSNDLPAGTCSTAALIHVLDHLVNPFAFLEKIRAALESGGVVLIVTHNVASFLARILGKRFPPFTLQHPQLFSPKSITRLLDRSGFEVVEVVGSVNYFPIMHLFRAGLSVLGMPAFGRGLDGPTVPLKLGNMAIVARKV